MNIRETAQIALLLAVGYILHLVAPGYGAGMKPDVLLGMLFVIILIYRSFRVALTAGVVAGLITAFTTTFPGGQIPNILDKILTGIAVFLLVKVLAAPLEKLMEKASFEVFGIKTSLGSFASSVLIGLIGTVFSGTVFLLSALAIVGLPAPFKILFATVVIPATVANAVVTAILYPLVSLSRKALGAGREKTLET